MRLRRIRRLGRSCLGFGILTSRRRSHRRGRVISHIGFVVVVVRCHSHFVELAICHIYFAEVVRHHSRLEVRAISRICFAEALHCSRLPRS